MEKVKLVLPEYEQQFEMIKIVGQEVKVYKEIPYTDKVSFAQEYASQVCVIDEGKGIAFETYDVEALRLYMMLKWYTNIDVSEYDFDMGKLHDLMKDYELAIINICGRDLDIAENMMRRYTYKTIEIYNQQNSLAQKIKTSFAGILTGEDLVSAIAESRTVNEELITLFSKVQKQDELNQNVVMFPWAAKKE